MKTLLRLKTEDNNNKIASTSTKQDNESLVLQIID